MNPKDAEEYTQALGQVVAGGWRQIALAQRLGVPKALKLSVEEWVKTRLGGYVKYSIAERKEAIKALADDGHSERKIKGILGIDRDAIRNHLGKPRTGRKPTNPTIESLDIQPETGRKPTSSPVEVVTYPNCSIRPFYQAQGITIYHGDCREILPQLPRGLMVTDPPYNVDYHYDEHDDALDEPEYWALLRDVLRMPLVCIHYPEALYHLAQPFRQPPSEVVAWIYHANTPRQWRSIAWFGARPDFSLDGQPYQNPNDKRVALLIAAGKMARLYDWWPYEQVKNVSTQKTDHPCQIPLIVMLKILTITPTPGLVIDPFCGSGTTLLAAQKLGRQAIGIERSEQYCAIAVERLRQSVLPLAAS